RNLYVIIELVVNHTSDRHTWFQRAREAPPNSPEREFYVWSYTDKKYSDARIIFTDTEKSNWTWDPVANAYCWHRFFSHQPDLNFDNPAVLECVISAMKFWLDMGVDGLRLDAIPYLVEREGTDCENLPETHAVIKAIRKELDRYEDRMMLADNLTVRVNCTNRRLQGATSTSRLGVSQSRRQDEPPEPAQQS